MQQVSIAPHASVSVQHILRRKPKPRVQQRVHHPCRAKGAAEQQAVGSRKFCMLAAVDLHSASSDTGRLQQCTCCTLAAVHLLSPLAILPLCLQQHQHHRRPAQKKHNMLGQALCRPQKLQMHPVLRTHAAGTSQPLKNPTTGVNTSTEVVSGVQVKHSATSMFKFNHYPTVPAHALLLESCCTSRHGAMDLGRKEGA